MGGEGKGVKSGQNQVLMEVVEKKLRKSKIFILLLKKSVQHDNSYQKIRLIWGLRQKPQKLTLLPLRSHMG